ncbi:hypothetical protein PILCRDRAFT_391816 [Piloderma croceum F 1598]|uniref:Uncharacterized protein n=1 Tax=Piloderma croceum (strain F 1598) TaxID=765440 RepID=A0A0C3FYB9_PILCF|nr:hypothetical protein PILCRDRAFT_391816 [Piloderma croceum F 1598]
MLNGCRITFHQCSLQFLVNINILFTDCVEVNKYTKHTRSLHNPLDKIRHSYEASLKPQFALRLPVLFLRCPRCNSLGKAMVCPTAAVMPPKRTSKLVRGPPYLRCRGGGHCLLLLRHHTRAPP